MMKRIFLLLFLLPVFALAQKAKPKTKAKVNTKPIAMPADGFVINAEIKGFPEGTTVALLNGVTGATESETTIKADKFEFKGKMERPDFKIILFNKQPPFITLFLDNSKVKITGVKETIDKAKVTGTDRVELYTESFAKNYPADKGKAITPYIAAAKKANELGLGINAGHDLDLNNLKYFAQNIPGLLEVSIGHALICDAIYLGLENAVQLYKRQLK